MQGGRVKENKDLIIPKTGQRISLALVIGLTFYLVYYLYFGFPKLGTIGLLLNKIILPLAVFLLISLIPFCLSYSKKNSAVLMVQVVIFTLVALGVSFCFGNLIGGIQDLGQKPKVREMTLVQLSYERSYFRGHGLYSSLLPHYGAAEFSLVVKDKDNYYFFRFSRLEEAVLQPVTKQLSHQGKSFRLKDLTQGVDSGKDQA